MRYRLFLLLLIDVFMVKDNFVSLGRKGFVFFYNFFFGLY